MGKSFFSAFFAISALFCFVSAFIYSSMGDYQMFITRILQSVFLVLFLIAIGVYRK